MSGGMSDTFRPEGPQGSWWSRNWLWFVPAMGVLLCVCPVGCCGGFFVTIINGLKSTEPYQTALTRVKQDPVVIERLGEPIEAAWMVNGKSEFKNDTGSATYDFQVSGPKGTADVHTEAVRSGGVWETTVLRVTFGDGSDGHTIVDSTVPDPRKE
jgi:hypothetical protein